MEKREGGREKPCIGYGKVRNGDSLARCTMYMVYYDIFKRSIQLPRLVISFVGLHRAVDAQHTIDNNSNNLVYSR